MIRRSPSQPTEERPDPQPRGGKQRPTDVTQANRLTPDTDGIAQVCFYDEEFPGEPVLSIGFSCAGRAAVPTPLILACAAQACAGGYRLGFSPHASSDRQVGLASIIFHTGSASPDASSMIRVASPGATFRLFCVVGQPVPADFAGFDGCCVAASWNAALAPMRLLVPAPGLIGYDRADAIASLSGRITQCEIWQLGDKPGSLASTCESVWLGFSNRLPLIEVDRAAGAIGKALPGSAELNLHASVETSDITCIDVMLGRSGA